MSKVAIIGNGNVGTHLCNELSKKHEVSVFVRSPKSEKEQPISSLTPLFFDFIILAVSDNAIEEVSNQIPKSDAIVIHVSGFKEMSVLEKHPNHGVFYALQTFTKDKTLDFSKVPLYLEGSSDEVDMRMFALARTVSNDIHSLTSDNRKQMHIAAVFVSNFTNHLYLIADDILQDFNMKFDDVKHLALETLKKAAAISPKNAQTGPAIRNDSTTINAHLELLKDESVKHIYQTITDHIQKTHH